MERAEQRRITEALILASSEPVSAQRLAEIVPGLRPAGVREVVEELNAEYVEQRRGFEVVETAGGYQVRTLAELAPYLQRTLSERPLRLSQAALETLAVVAYRQPVTRAEIEHVRGVDVGAVLRSLLERGLVRLAGHREVPGRPLLYATTRRFLEVFGLPRLEDLPTLRELKEFEPPAGVAAVREPGEGSDALPHRVAGEDPADEVGDEEIADELEDPGDEGEDSEPPRAH